MEAVQYSVFFSDFVVYLEGPVNEEVVCFPDVAAYMEVLADEVVAVGAYVGSPACRLSQCFRFTAPCAYRDGRHTVATTPYVAFLPVIEAL